MEDGRDHLLLLLSARFTEIVGRNGRMKEGSFQFQKIVWDSDCRHLIHTISYVPETICEEQQLMSLSSPPTRQRSMTAEPLIKQSVSSRSMNLPTKTIGLIATFSIVDSTRVDEVIRLSLPGCRRRDALLRYGCWTGGTKRNKCKNAQYLACKRPCQ